jgi:hypothetical protein
VLECGLLLGVATLLGRAHAQRALELSSSKSSATAGGSIPTGPRATFFPPPPGVLRRAVACGRRRRSVTMRAGVDVVR